MTSKILGMDYGEKRIGLATAHRGLKVATPLETVKTDEIFVYLKEFIIEENVDLIVVGHPISLSGNITESTLRAANFAETIRETFNVEVVLWDERLTTKEIEKNIIARLAKNGKKKASNSAKDKVDALSACLILQNYLDYVNLNEGDGL